MCQLYDKVGHSAKVCRSRPRLPAQSHWPQANLTTTPTTSDHNWIVDSGASHHITSDLQNLSIHNNYGGTEDIIIGDGKGIPITHTGSTLLNSPTTTFTLDDVLCAPYIKRNLISVSQFCKQNNTSIEFFPNSFLVKDLSTGASLVQGQSKDNVYEWPSLPQIQQPTAYSSVAASIDVWHRRLGHPSLPIQNKLLSRYSLPTLTNNRVATYCDACLHNKSHRLSFSVSSISCSKPFEIIYTDVWGPAPVTSFDKFSFYVIFVDYFTKYTWLYPLSYKSDVSLIFSTFQKLVENYFQSTIKTVYSDGGSEYQALASHF